MDPIVLVMVFCTQANQYRCWNDPKLQFEKTIVLSEEESRSPMGCMMQSQPTIAKYLEAQPNWLVRKWYCKPLSKLTKNI